MDLALMDWLNQYTFPEEENYEELQYAEKVYGVFVGALKKGATTSTCIKRKNIAAKFVAGEKILT